MKNISKYITFIVAGLFIVTLIFFSGIIDFITDLWWFSEVGFRDVFLKSLTAKLILGFSAGLITAVFLLTNLFLATHTKIPWISSIPASLIGQQVNINGKTLKKAGSILSLLMAIFVGLIAAANWQEVLKFFQAVSFNQKDPLFSQDVSFYIFSLPVYSLGLGLAKTIITISLIGCGFIYILRRSFQLPAFISKFVSGSGKNGHAHFTADTVKQTDPKARVHIGMLLFLLLAAIAAGTYLSMFNLLTMQSGPVFGAAFTDTNIMIPLLQATYIIYALAALFALFYGISGNIKPLLGAIAITFVISLASLVIPSLFQKLIVAPNELVKETPFIKYNIDATRKAYDINKIEKRQITADKPLTSEEIENNNLTIKNVRLWDRDPLLSTFSQIQEIRTYYEFPSVDNDRYLINNEIRQIMLSPRELASDSLPNKNWINEHLSFTHGYGIAAGPVNQVTPEGLPVLFVKNLPPVSEVKELTVTKPEIYYGEILNEYVIVKTNSREFDYPKGDENVYAKYQGTGGVALDSPLKKLLYAIRFGSLKMLLSGDITNESRIMYHRNVKERVEKIAPFLKFDNDPYLVVAEGKLYWIFDAYTTTSRYPYSQQLPMDGRDINYIRNSVKAVVDTYDGKVIFYRSDENDPIIRTYSKIFPDMFQPLSNMPKSLAQHLRYPEDIFTLQTNIYATYHMDDPQMFYNKEDQWEVPSIAQGSEQQTGTVVSMTPRHMIMKLPDEEKEEFILMLPFTPRAKDNLSAWMVARNDNEAYGKLAVYQFPKDKLVFGPKQIIGRINQDAEVSRQISLWDQRGSQVIQGTLLVIPIEKSLVYVLPLYLKAENGKIPELKRVIVAYDNKIAMEETLEKGLARIFGTATAPAQPQPAEQSADQPAPAQSVTDQDNADLLRQANDTYNAAIEAQRNGDWTKYGEEIRKLGDLLKKL